MRARWWMILMAILVAAPAFASGGKEPASSATPSSEPPREGDKAASEEPSVRKQAEHAYADAFEQIVKAKADAQDGKEKDAAKKFKRGLESAREAVRLDPKYHEAWNMIGFASRKLGDYDGALQAYATCLDLKPDYAPAREYLGEAYVELDQIDKARAQLVMLDHQQATEEAAQLKAKIDAWDAAHPKKEEAAKPAAGSGN
jgi:tetratricopeptide (TPR) repeat protein